MSGITIIRQSIIERTPRVMQMEGIFDVAPSEKSVEKWDVNIELPDEWNIGLIVGPSGCGKTTIANELWKNEIVKRWNWSRDKSILDDFPKNMSIKEIINLLSSVGFSSPPSWVRSFNVLSNGEQFRVFIARTLAEKPELSVIDEFTSVVDRTVAKIGSSAIQKTVRKRNQQFIAVSCHYDIIDWLEPDWVYQPHTNEFYSGRYLHQRPEIKLEIKRVHHSAWRIFRRYHYLDTNLNKSSICFVAFWEGKPVAFTAILHFPHPIRKNTKREHRTVCLPDYQGAGIGNAMSDYIGSLCNGMGYSFISTTSHPAMIGRRAKSERWHMIAKPNRKTQTMGKAFAGKDKSKKTLGFAKRLRATFEYVGGALDKEEAKRVWNND